MKKFLSMVLALAMAMSLVTFASPAAGAKDYPDSGSITKEYKEAVDVISAIEIMGGRTDGNFAPSETLTRGAAAKIICNMILGPTTASALPANVAPFPDVPAGHTYAGYIAYCADHNIISGYADGNFRPGDSLSGYAFLKMLLCALGYDQDIEGYKGANWRVNVAKQALGIGLDDGLRTELDGSRIVTREEAALYAFNTLQSDLVEYDNKTTVSVSGATVTVGGDKYHSKTGASQSTAFNNIDDGANAGNAQIIQFAEEYFNRLRREPTKNRDFDGGQDKFGRPSTKWYWKGVEVGTYENVAAQTYTGDVKINQIYNDLGLAGTAEDAKVYVNGMMAFSVDIERSNDTKIGKLSNADVDQRWTGMNAGVADPYDLATAADGLAEYKDRVGDGTIIEVFHDEGSNKVVICAMSVYPGKVNSVSGSSSTKDAYASIDYLYLPNGNANRPELTTGAAAPAIKVVGVAATPKISAGTYSKNGHDEYTTTAFQEDDYVWFTYSIKDHSIGVAQKMESAEGKLDRRIQNDEVQLDGKVYDFAKEWQMDIAQNNLTNNSSYIVWLDGNGNMLWLEEAEFSAEQYALIQRIYVEKSDGTGVWDSTLNGVGNETHQVDAFGNATGMASWDSSRVRLLMSNGTERTVDLDESKRYRATNAAGADVSVNPTFQAGELVRYVENSDGTYRLYPISGAAGDATGAVGVFEITSGHQMNGLVRTSDGQPVNADSDTIFVVKSDESTRVYTGIKNAPTVVKTAATATAAATGAYAYAYVTTGNKPVARLVYVVKSNGEILNSSKDITFLAGKSKAGPYVSDEGSQYFEYNAVVKGVIQDYPVRVYRYENGNDNLGVQMMLEGSKNSTRSGVAYNDGNAYSVVVGDDSIYTGSIILNSVTYDTDDYMKTASYVSSAGVSSNVAQGIKRTNKSDLVKIDTHNDGEEQTIASGANIYYVDDDGIIAQITISDIKNDNDDMIYYTMDDGEITNLFICDYEDDSAFIADTRFVGMNIDYKFNEGRDDDSYNELTAAANADKLAAQVVKALNLKSNIASVSYNDATNVFTVSTKVTNDNGTETIAAPTAYTIGNEY